MVNYMDKQKIIDQKQQGLSNREVARRTGIDRKTGSKYWNEYQRRLQRLDEPGADIREVQDSLLATPKYNAANRKRHKYTEELDKRLKAILKEEERKERRGSENLSHGGAVVAGRRFPLAVPVHKQEESGIHGQPCEVLRDNDVLNNFY